MNLFGCFRRVLWLTIVGAVAVTNIARAGVADVVDVKVEREAGGTYHFDVSVRHADTGWDHYADRWEILAPDGTVLATRPLRHPHVDEQPFTRDLSGVAIPKNLHKVTLRAHDSQHGFGGREITVTLPP